MFSAAKPDDKLKTNKEAAIIRRRFIQWQSKTMFEKLYSIKLPMDAARQSLYIKGNLLDIKDASICLKKNQTLDFATYFNLFSARKWKIYTSIRDVRIQLHIRGNYKITVYEVSQQQKRELYSETGHDDYQKDIPLKPCQANFITFTLTALE